MYFLYYLLTIFRIYNYNKMTLTTKIKNID
nr:MAG TPA: hypothetical protein [Caudoviricetes sp.]